LVGKVLLGLWGVAQGADPRWWRAGGIHSLVVLVGLGVGRV